MHTLQWVVVETDNQLVDSKLEAAQIADRSLEDELSPWYDWYIVGGGRWNVTEGEEDWASDYELKTNLIISHKEDPNGFRGKIMECIEKRIEQFNQYRAEIENLDILGKLSNYGGAMTYDMELYPLVKALNIFQGIWDTDSQIFDLTSGSSNLGYILSQMDRDEGDNLFLVPIDFHY